MSAIVYRGVNDLRLETVPVPLIGPHELLVKVAACGVCPTDIKKIRYGLVAPPRVFGHETAGTIVRVGARVRGFRIGDRVALHHHVPCLKCHACRHRAFAQCATYKKTGITAGFEPAGGGYAEYVRVMSFVLPGVVKIPDRNSFLEGAMLEPVNTVLKAVNRLELLKGDSVLVAGQGPIGLMFTRILALRGMKVLATDLLDARLKLAGEFGAKWTVNVGTESLTAKYAKYAKAEKGSTAEYAQGQKGLTAEYAEYTEKNGGRKTLHAPRSTLPPAGFDAAIIAVPSQAVVKEAQELVRGGGKVLLFSHTKRGEEMPIDLARICVDEKDLIGSYSADFLLQKEAAKLVFSRKLDTRKLITHQFPLEQTAQAIALASKPTPDALKVVVMQG
jgi:L-iditol 2-dehydrogenase